MRYFISPVDMVGTLGSATHIVFGINNHNFQTFYNVTKKVHEIEKIIGNTSEISVMDPLELCTLITLKVNDKMPDGLVKLINDRVLFQIGNPKELEEYGCCDTAYELDEWDEVYRGVVIGRYDQQVYINDGNGNEYRSLSFTPHTNFRQWNLDEVEVKGYQKSAYTGFIMGMNCINIKLTDNLKNAIINRFLIDPTKRDNLRILTIPKSKLKKSETEYFFEDMSAQKARQTTYNGTLTLQLLFDKIMSRCRPLDLTEADCKKLIDYVSRV